MLTLGSGTPQSQETDAVVYDRQDLGLYRFVITPPTGSADIPTITLKPMQAPLTNPLTLTGLTPADTLTNTGKGGWPLVSFKTGSLAGTAALLSAYDNVVVFVNVSTMTEVSRIQLPTGSGVPFRIVADPVNGRAIVAFANVGAATSTTFVAITPTGKPQLLAAVAQNVLAVGCAVSADGSKLYACQRDTCLALDNK
jgi:hypothetical protein